MIKKVLQFNTDTKLNFKNIGDSGGGLYAYDSNLKKYIIVGIVSYGIGILDEIYGLVFETRCGSTPGYLNQQLFFQ